MNPALCAEFILQHQDGIAECNHPTDTDTEHEKSRHYFLQHVHR